MFLSSLAFDVTNGKCFILETEVFKVHTKNNLNKSTWHFIICVDWIVPLCAACVDSDGHGWGLESCSQHCKLHVVRLYDCQCWSMPWLTSFSTCFAICLTSCRWAAGCDWLPVFFNSHFSSRHLTMASMSFVGMSLQLVVSYANFWSSWSCILLPGGRSGKCQSQVCDFEIWLTLIDFQAFGMNECIPTVDFPLSLAISWKPLDACLHPTQSLVVLLRQFQGCIVLSFPFKADVSPHCPFLQLTIVSCEVAVMACHILMVFPLLGCKDLLLHLLKVKICPLGWCHGSDVTVSVDGLWGRPWVEFNLGSHSCDVLTQLA